MRKIVATFKNGESKTHCWSFDQVEPEESGTKIRQALERLTTSNIFDEAGIEIFKQVLDAKFVETIETVLFGEESAKDSEEAEGIQALERLLPDEAAARKLELTQKIDLLFEQYSAGMKLKGFRFEAVADDLDSESDKEPEVFLRELD